MSTKKIIAAKAVVPMTEPLNIAPCLAHPCDAPGKNPCKSTCAFARTNLAGAVSQESLKTIIAAKTYGCSMGGVVKKTFDGQLVMQVGNKIFPSQDPLFHPEVAAAQGRLDAYIAQK